MKKYTLISAGISVALFATALTVSLVTNSSTNKRVEEGLADLTNQIESLKSETSQKLTGLETQLSETKAALDAAKNNTSSKFEKLEGDVKAEVEALKAADAANLASLQGAVDAVESALETAKKELKDADAANIKTVEDRIALAEKALENVNTALDARVAALETSSVANAEALSALEAELAEIAQTIGGGAAGGAESLSDWVVKFGGEEAVATKAAAVSALNKAYTKLVIEYYELFDYLDVNDLLKTGFDKVGEQLRDGYYQGMVKIALAVAGDNGNLATTITAANEDLDELVEPLRVEWLRNELDNKFNSRVDELINGTSKVVGVNEMNINNVDAVVEAIEAVKLEKKSYEKLTTSEELTNVLNSTILKVEIPYYVALLNHEKNTDTATIKGFENLKDVKMSADKDAKGYVETRVANIAKVVFEKDTIEKSTTREEAKSLFDAKNELVEIELQLATNLHLELDAQAAYYAEAFGDKENGKYYSVNDETGIQYLSDEEIKAAKEAYEATMAQYNWLNGDGRSSAELKKEYIEVIGYELDKDGKEDKTKPIYNPECEFQAVKDAVAQYEELYQLGLLKDTANDIFLADKEELKVKLTNDFAGKLTDAELAAATRMVDVVEMDDVNDYTSIATIKAEQERVYTILDNIYALAKGEAEENVKAKELYTAYDSNKYTTEFSSAELNGIEKELAQLDAAHKFIDSIYSNTMTTADLTAKVTALDAKEIKEVATSREAAFNDVQKKYEIVLEVRTYAQEKVDYVNDVFSSEAFTAKYSESVGNDYGYEFRRLGDFISVPTVLTAAEVQVEAGTPTVTATDKKGNPTEWHYNNTTDGYLGSINAIYHEADALYGAFYFVKKPGEFNKEDGSHRRIDYINTLIEGEKAGLSTAMAKTYTDAIEALGDPNDLYQDIKDAIENGSNYKNAIKSYADAVNEIVASAEAHKAARVDAAKNKTTNATTIEKQYADWAVRGHNDVNLVTKAGKIDAKSIEEVVIVVDAEGKVIFALDTVAGQLPTPTDKFYHDGTFKAVNGTTSSIFKFGDNYDGTKKDKDGKVIETGKGVYEVVLPEGATLITGTAEAMVEVVDRAFGTAGLSAKPGTLDKVTINDLFDTYTETAWNAFVKEVTDLNNATNTEMLEKSKTTAAVKAAQDKFTADFKAIVEKYDELYKELDANVLAAAQEAAILEIETLVISARKEYPQYDYNILKLRAQYKTFINDLDYSYEVEPKMNEFVVKLGQVCEGLIVDFTALDPIHTMTADKFNQDAGGDAIAVITGSDKVFHTDGTWDNGYFKTSWRLMVSVDVEGKVAYLVLFPASGFGNPGQTHMYYTHPDYSADYTKNPVFNLLPGYEVGNANFEIKIPVGGFMITGHGTDAMELLASFGITVTNPADPNCWEVNKPNNGMSENIRVAYDGGQIKVYQLEEEEVELQ